MAIFFIVLIVFSMVPPKINANQNLPEQFQLLPVPHRIELLEGDGLKFGKLQTVFIGEGVHRPVMGNLLANLPESTKDGENVLSLKIENKSWIPESTEGYVLTISYKKVEINARGQTGLFYGCQTLQQLLEDSQEANLPVPACKITDYPAISFRAIHIDVKHHLDHMKYYYDLVDRMARYKLNAIIFEFEDKLRYRRQPVVGAAHAISIEEMAALTHYARKRHVEINPLVQGLGHASYILKHECYQDIRDNPNSDWTFCPLNEKTYQVQFDLYRDAIEATPGSRYLHIGGDEVGSLGKSKLTRASGKNAFELQMEWLGRVAEFVKKNQRIPIIWDDMMLKYSGIYRSTWDSKIELAEAEEMWSRGRPKLEKLLSLFPRNCIYMRWNYGAPKIPGNQLALKWYHEKGLQAMAATAAQCTSPMLPRNERIQAIQDFNSITAKYGLSGILCTAWDDASPHFETYWRGLIGQADFSWAPDQRDRAQFLAAYRQREFGVTARDDKYAFQDELADALSFWDTALLQDGVRQSFWKRKGKFKLLELPKSLGGTKSIQGVWTKKNIDRLIQAEKEIVRYQKIKSQIRATLQNARRNRFTLRLLNAINELQIQSAYLLLAIKAADSPEKSPLERAEKQIRKTLNQFIIAKKNLLSVYGETRFLKNPPDYLLDQNHHTHLANRSNDSSWMFLFEIPFCQQVRTWLESMAE